MALINIHTFQNGVDKSSLLTSYTDEYISSALNLGQRSGVKGDGLESGEFRALDIIGNISSIENLEDCYIRADYNVGTNSVSFQLYDAANKKLDGSVLDVAIEPEYATTKDIQLSTFGGSDVLWYEGGLIKKYDDRYYILFKTSSAKSGESEDSIIAEEIDAEGNLIRAIICAPVSVPPTGTSYVERTYIITKGTATGVYVMNAYYDSDETITHDIDEIYDAVQGKSYDEVLSIVTYKTDRHPLTNLSIGYDGEQFTPASGTEYTEDILDVCTRLGYHIKPWFKEVASIFNKEIFFKNYDNSSIKQHIVATLVKSVYDYICANDYITDADGYGMYFPVEYVFHYYANSNDDTKILTSSHPIYIYYRGDFDITLDPLDVPGCILADSSIDKTVGFNFNIDYTDDIISSISAQKDRVLPYINGDGYWVVDDTVTSVSGIGKNAGQPNIIITKTEYDDSETLTGTVIYCAAYESDSIVKLNDGDRNSENLWYKLPQANNNDGYNTNANAIKLTSVLPGLDDLDNDDTKKYLLENALIISLITVDEDDDLKEELSSGFVPVIWSVVKEDNTYVYKYLGVDGLLRFSQLTDPEYALDVNDFINLENYVNSIIKAASSEPDTNIFKHIVFSALSNSYKQTYNETKNLYPTIRNKSLRTDEKDDVEYIDPMENIGTELHIYTNPLNEEIEYTDAVVFDNDGIASIGRNSSKKAFGLVKTSVAGEDGYFIEDVVPYNNYPEEVIPNSKTGSNMYPSVNLKEVFVQNPNVLNRTNIIGVAKAANYGRVYDGEQSYLGEMYYGYFGVSPDSPDRDVLRIGTATHDINMGTAALTDIDSTKNLKKFTKLSVDIDNTTFNGDVSFKGGIDTDESVWSKVNLETPEGTYTIYSTVFTPVGLKDDLFYAYTEKDVIGDNEYRYIYERLGLSCTYIEREISYIDVPKLIRMAGITEAKYPSYVIEADPERYFPDDQRYRLEMGLKPYMSFGWLKKKGINDAYIGNPISISYMNGDPKYTYFEENTYHYIYGFNKANAYTVSNENWSCDGCTQHEGGAGDCSFRGICKYTSFKYTSPGFTSECFWADGATKSKEEVEKENSTVSYYSKWAALKLGIGNVNPDWEEEEYEEIAKQYPSTYSFSYAPHIIPVPSDPASAYTKGNHSYYSKDTFRYSKCTYTAYINLREIGSTDRPIERRKSYLIDFVLLNS